MQAQASEIFSTVRVAPRRIVAQHVASTPATKHMTNPLLWLRNALFGRPDEASPEQNPAPIAPESTPSVASLEGTQRGWLRVLPAGELLTALHAHEALDAIWRQSRLSQEVWQRDLLPGIERMAELVQLMPASESHHHAHAGGLLAHTLEMTLTALTWRNGCLLPEGAPIEQIDRERDQWSYAVFFASLLHDIAKPMTDLSITWRATRMPQPLRWSPISGSLVQVTHGWDGAEYHVDFTPKSQRDYGAHSRLALALFPSVAPESARALLSRTPGALQALEKYLGGQDKASLLARTVIDADRRSVANALMRGSRARFDSAASVPLIELLMQALRDLLKSGALPLNRDGAAGWVYDGCMWLVAKRAADSARTWIKEHAPEESIPGEAKNDRLFDTWQEYGCIRTNPLSGQAIWYVRVHGTAPDGEGDGEATYCHDLSVLCFPLEKLYDDASHYPEAMHGRIEVREKRKTKGEATVDAPEATPPREGAKVQDAQKDESADVLDEDETAASVAAPTVTDTPDAKGGKDERGKPAKKQVRPEPDDIIGDDVLRAPSFNRPKPKPKKPKAEKKEGASTPENEPVPAPELPKEATAQGEPGELLDAAKGDETISIGAPDGVFGDVFDADDEATEFLDDKDSATAAAIAYKAEQKVAKGQGRETKETCAGEPVAAPKPRKDAPSAPQRAQCDLPPPVVLTPELPALPMAEKRAEPSEAALAFIQWVQQGLAGHVLRYNEKGAPVHFVAEGMALISPLIFRRYVEETGGATDPFELQREVIRAGWHRVQKLGGGKGQSNILRYEVVGKGGRVKNRLSAVVLADAGRWVQPLPPDNAVLRLVEEAGETAARNR